MPASPCEIRLELTPPYRVNDQPARFQSLWLLARLHYAAAYENGQVPASVVQLHFAANRTIRMLVSRAFADFSSWGVEVGWGAPVNAPVNQINPASRSRGPFWLPTRPQQNLRPLIGGQAATRRQLEHFLGLDRPPAAAASSAHGLHYLMQDLAYWSQLTEAMRDEREGMGRLRGRQAAESFHAARSRAGNDFQQALALMKESLAWRRSAQLEDSRLALKKLGRVLEGGHFSGAQPTFAAMACIVRAWEYYARDEPAGALACLEQLQNSAELQPMFRYNPRVRFECLNLSALLHKRAALNGKRIEHCRQQADIALQALAGALEAAYEADSIDAVQHVAANIGWCLWLFWQHGLTDAERRLEAPAVQRQAMRWLGLSEWICDRFGVGNGSGWNIIFLLRVARGACRAGKRPSLRQFRAQPPLPLAAMQAAFPLQPSPFSVAKGFRSWSAVALLALEEHGQERLPLTPLQQANLLLEAAWFLTMEQGLSLAACGHAQRLRLLLPQLRRSERNFFRDELDQLPPELLEPAQ
nr:hypothetical protein [Chromobacterium sp. ASV5]